MPPKRIHLVRHAQGYHNLYDDHSIRDPLLTPQGEQQCAKLANEINTARPIDCIIASPMRRALYTALLTFRVDLENNPDLKIIAIPELQETGLIQADIGVSREELEETFRDYPIDFSLVTPDWNEKNSGRFSPVVGAIDARGRYVRRLLYERTEATVAVVSHGSFLHFLTEDWADSARGDGKTDVDGLSDSC